MMGPWSPTHGKDGKQKEQEASLSLVLNLSQREQLTLLIANITASMRKSLVDNFDASQTSPLNSSSISKLPSSEEENPNVDTTTLSPDDREKAEKARESREKILSTPKLQELRVAALDFFQRWEANVLKRVREEVEDSAEKQEDEAEGVLQPPVVETKVVDEHTEDEEVDRALHALYPPVPTALTKLKKEQKV